MSLTAAPPPASVAGAPSSEHCLQCGAALAGDQEWCLECGAARTYVHRSPDWRIPVGIVAGVVALALAGFAIALINLSSSASRTVPAAANQARTPSTVPAVASQAGKPSTAPAAASQAGKPSTAPASTPTPATQRFAGWPAGLPGWTVQLASRRTQAIAQRVATKLAAAGITVGILNGSQYPSLKTDRWIVFSGRYPTQAAAQAQATALIAKDGHARARLVAPPGA